MKNGGLQGEGFAYDFVVVEVMLYAFDLLIVLVTFAGNEDDVAWLCQRACCANCFAAVDNADNLSLIFGFGYAGKHVIDDCLRFLETRIVGGDDDAV